MKNARLFMCATGPVFIFNCQIEYCTKILKCEIGSVLIQREEQQVSDSTVLLLDHLGFKSVHSKLNKRFTINFNQISCGGLWRSLIQVQTTDHVT